MTQALEMQKWLRKNGPKTITEIRRAGFGGFSGPTRARMLACGAIKAYTGENPNANLKYARAMTTLYIAGEQDYTPKRGRSDGGDTKLALEAAKVARWIKALEARGYVVTISEAS